MTVTKKGMAAHMTEAHSFLKLEGLDEVAPAKKSALPAKKLEPSATLPKAPKKRKLTAPRDPNAPKRRAPDNSAANDLVLRTRVLSAACADIAPAWQCLACREQFADTTALHEHVLRRHCESDDNKDGPLKLRIHGYCCPVCGRGFDELEYMIAHQLATHPDADPPSLEDVQKSAAWALLCSVCLQYYRRSDKWFSGHHCQNWADLEALERTKSQVAAQPCFLCDVCAATFRYKCAYQYHRQMRHKGVTELKWEELTSTVIPFVCEKCDKGFAKLDDFKAHVCDVPIAPVAPPLDKPKVPCPQCNALLANEKIMRRHIKTVHEKSTSPSERKKGDCRKYRSEVPTIRCPFCEDLRFRTTKDMVAHAKLVHNQELPNPYFCAKCMRQFASNAKLNRHYEVHHSGPEDKETIQAVCAQAERTKDDVVFYMCPSCARKFLDPMEYFRHYQWHQMKRDFTCDRCGYGASTKESLNLHMRSVHLEPVVRKFACNLCDSVLSSQFSMREHMAATHGTERPYVCERCGKDFPTKVRLQSHIRVHLFGSQLSMSQRRYGCDLCGKDFKKKQTLRDHLAVHTGIKNEACEVCGKLFFTKLSAYCHKVQTHSTVRPYKCTICEAAFPMRAFLTRHMKKHAEREARKALNAVGNAWMSPADKKAARKMKELVEESNSDTEEQSYYEEYSSKSFIGEEL